MQTDTQGVKTIFDAVPDRLVADKIGTYRKSSKKNLYYIILGYQSLHTNEYFVNYYILCKSTSTKKPSISLIKTKHHGLEVFKTKTQVMEFIYKFLEGFSDHERILNTFSLPSRTMNFDLFIDDVGEWVEKIISIFEKHA